MPSRRQICVSGRLCGPLKLRVCCAPQAKGRLLRSKALTEASYASIAGLEKGERGGRAEAQRAPRIGRPGVD